MTVARAHAERLADGTEVRLGVWLSNTKSRRGKLSADKLAALADLGVEWAPTRQFLSDHLADQMKMAARWSPAR
ncbi:hypothetical protein [Streptomyces sp. enrichment culture]|uniref:hypothetical protein n=1 Tax=Streptomyces sp. enrichment culture TaxID=1795815 RepID=UPI003F57C42B